MTKVVNRRQGASANAVYVGRPTRWGNPFVVGRDGVEGECARRYRAYLWSNAELLRALPELFERDLECWCAPKACHADALLAAARWAQENPQALADRIRELEGE